MEWISTSERTPIADFDNPGYSKAVPVWTVEHGVLLGQYDFQEHEWHLTSIGGNDVYPPVNPTHWIEVIPPVQ